MTTDAVRVNLDEWGRTLRDYVQFSSKTMEEALNGKLRDLMFRCKEKTVLGMTRAEVVSRIRSLRAVAVKRLKDRYGRFTREEVTTQMRRIGLGRGFMRSAFIKAANMIPRNEASAYGTTPMSAARFSKTSASVALATINQLAANAECRWSTQGATDTTGKQSIADSALAAALGDAVADMRNYMREKLLKKAQQASAR